MNTHGWFSLTYEATDATAQENLAQELRNLGNLHVQTESGHLVRVRCSYGSPAPTAVTLHELVMSIDPDAILVEAQSSETPCD